MSIVNNVDALLKIADNEDIKAANITLNMNPVKPKMTKKFKKFQFQT